MPARSIRVLHVEDDEMQRQLFHAQLRAVPNFSFAVTAAATEDSAVAKFPAGFDLVVIDYHLGQGDGLNCLRRIRLADGAVPIITISGVATPEIAADLLEAGADDYLSKDVLDPAGLGRSIEAAVVRGDAWKARAPEPKPDVAERFTGLFQQICDAYVEAAISGLAGDLDGLENIGRSAGLNLDHAIRTFDVVCDQIARQRGRPVAQVKKTLRPMILEIVLRLFDDADPKATASSLCD